MLTRYSAPSDYFQTQAITIFFVSPPHVAVDLEKILMEATGTNPNVLFLSVLVLTLMKNFSIFYISNGNIRRYTVLQFWPQKNFLTISCVKHYWTESAISCRPLISTRH